MKMRSNAILFPIASLPGDFGIGTLGEEAKAFITNLANSGVTYWQILPIGQPSEDSPYQCFSAFAGNTWHIDPRFLVNLGFLKESELKEFFYQGEQGHIDYDFVRKNSKAYLFRAYSRIDSATKNNLQTFLEDTFWLKDYASFMTIKDFYNGACFWEWEDEDLKHRDPKALDLFIQNNKNTFYYYVFVQWLFYLSWKNLKQFANEKGLGIFGDIPFYVSSDSSDIWSQPNLFCLDKNLISTKVAGVPPDYFSVDGQLWGNTLYDWEKMKAENYKWWISRLKHALELYDLLRIDHFRGFESYWVVPMPADTAKEGYWEEGPRLDFFETVSKALGAELEDLPIVAEDLGEIDDACRDFLKACKFPGMQVLQFSFNDFWDSKDLPFTWRKNLCAYTGTHDNNTLLGWLWEASESFRNYVLAYISFPNDQDWGRGGIAAPALDSLIRLVWSSVANMAVAPIQDFLGYGSDTRINIPGLATGMWTFRLTQNAFKSIDWNYIARLNNLYQRSSKYQMVYPELQFDRNKSI